MPITNGQPDMDNAYCTPVNPGRPIPKRPWISPGLTNHTLRDTLTLDAVEDALAARLNGRYLVGHNITVEQLTTAHDLTAKIDTLAAGSQPTEPCGTPSPPQSYS